jgi:hypothetical protein
LLSNWNPSLPVTDGVDTVSGYNAQFSDASASISPELARLEAPLPNELAIERPLPRISISVVELPSVISGSGGNEAASRNLVIEISGQQTRSAVSVGKIYLEDGWIVIELPIESVETYNTSTGDLPSNGFPGEAGSPFVAQDQKSKGDKSFELVLSGIRITADTPDLNAQIQGSQDVVLEHATKGSYGPVFESLVNHENSRNFAEPQESQPEASQFSPGVTFASQSSLDKQVAELAFAVIAQVSGGESPQIQGDAADLDTPPHAQTNLRSDSPGMVAEAVKGIRIRGAYVDPANAAEARSVVDLAVFQFEKPVTVRLQLPFVLDVEAEMTAPVSEESGLVESGSVAECVDAVLAGVDTSVTSSDVNWQVSGGVAILAAAFGYIIGSQRGKPVQGHVCAMSDEPFTPVFNEVQLSRISHRLRGITRQIMQPEAPQRKRGRPINNWVNSWLASRVAIAWKLICHETP